MPSIEDQRPIIVRSFPAGDRDFADATGEALEQARADAVEPATFRDLVEQRLRASYRNARIHAQDQFADLGNGDIVWYAYRDGRVRTNDPSRERLYTAFAMARRTVRESQVALEHARDVTRVAGYRDPQPPLPDGPVTAEREPPPDPDPASLHPSKPTRA